MNARVFLVLSTCLVVLGGCRASSASKSTEPPFTLKELAPNVWAAISNSRSSAPAPANTGFVIGDDGVAVVDASMSVDAEGDMGTDTARQTLAAIRTITKLPVRFVIDTHHHPDHVGGNAIFVEAGAIVLAQRNVRTWIHDENLRLFTKDSKPQHKAFMERLLPPTVTYDESVNLHLGTRMIRVQSLPGHTGGDSIVVIPDAKVVFAGDLLWRDIVPTLDDGSTKPWIDTLNRLATIEPGATFVPGHGEVGNAGDVATFREYLVTLRKFVSEGQAAGMAGEALADAIIPRLRDRYSRWDGFDYSARSNILETDAEIRGTKRIPQPDATR